ncbi:MAG: hypothetical protein KF767_15470 [Bdellovibrionaceae bacterium]|nr:hypothetical protein [Pseudobdellovibrionaceae bacterium]
MKIVYQAYGREDIVRQVLFSVVSLKSRAESTEGWTIEIYTDQPDRLQSFFAGWPEVKIVPITTADIQGWRGAIDFVHRVKLKILEKATESLHEPLIYLDGDTYFAKDPTALFAQISPTRSLMHIRESRLDEARDPLTKKIAKFVRKNSFSVDGASTQIPQSSEMWNAGVIGIHPANFQLLPLMVELTDQMYGRYQKHVMEQLAVSYLLQTKTVVASSHLEVIHYWPSKEAFDAAIGNFLASRTNASEALATIGDFHWPAPIQPQIKRSWLSRLFGP